MILGAVVALGWAMAQEPEPQLQASALASTSAYELGKPFDVALKTETPAPWHGYYRNPGTVGVAMQATLQAPEGFSVQGPYWQAPTLHRSEIGTAYVLESPVVVWRVTPQEGAPAAASFAFKVSAQMCSDEGCLPEQEVETSLDMAQGAPEPNPAWQGLEQKVETLGDAPLTDVRAERSASGAVLHFRRAGGADASGAYFFSDDNIIAPAAEQKLTRAEDGSFSLDLLRNDGEDFMYPAPEGVAGVPRLTGTLTFADGAHAHVDVEVQAAAAAEGRAGVPDVFWEAALGLFLGGLLLNFMPCVFPVLGLKIMSFVQLSGDSRRRVVGHSMAFVAGILISFWLLGLLLVTVSNADLLAQSSWQDWLGILWGDGGATDRTWAAWMQNKWVVYGILLLLLVLGMSMYGVFEIGVGATGIGSDLQQKGGLTGSFFQGFLITLVATPCSAPFLGASLAVVMAFPAVWMLLALTAMALGLALPYFILGIFPSLVRALPKPGAWMESLKQGLSFLMFAAAVWMLDVYLSFIGADRVWQLISIVVFCSAFWVYGRWCPIYRSRLSRCVGLLAALALAGVGIWGSLPLAPKHVWQEWSPEAMQQALEKGNPVFVDFTAKWCATCQSNKKIAYTDAVYKLMDEKDVVLMRADKTQPNAEIDAELRRLNRTAVPTNALYLPDAEPAVTGELLTPDYLYDFLSEHLKGE